MFQHLLNADILVIVLSVWGLGVALYLLKMYLQRQSSYNSRVQDRLTRIAGQSLGREKRQNP